MFDMIELHYVRNIVNNVSDISKHEDQTWLSRTFGVITLREERCK